jgi:hybrid cluster-associated redox disulfide protein
MIEKKMSIEEVVKKYPETIQVFERYGLGCVGCQAALFENIQQGAEIHGIDVNALVDSLNGIINKGS